MPGEHSNLEGQAKKARQANADQKNQAGPQAPSPALVAATAPNGAMLRSSDLEIRIENDDLDDDITVSDLPALLSRENSEVDAESSSSDSDSSDDDADVAFAQQFRAVMQSGADGWPRATEPAEQQAVRLSQTVDSVLCVTRDTL